jgi:hypothetical protein
MNDVPVWVAAVVIVLVVWRALDGPHSPDMWAATTQWLRQRLGRERR